MVDDHLVDLARRMYVSWMLLGCAKYLFDDVRSVYVTSGDVYDHIEQGSVKMSKIEYLR